MSTSTRIGDATQLWLLWKRAHETLRTAVVARTGVPADVSEPELSVLAWLHGAEGRARQSEIAHGLRWDRTRLSHLLTRMEKRGYVERVARGTGVEVLLAAEGERIVDAAAPVLEEVVRQELVDRLGEDDARVLRSILQRLVAVDPRSTTAAPPS